MRQDGEPSVEEILESIKKVIARDNRETMQAERRRQSTVGMTVQPPEPADADEADEVLELHETEAELPVAGEYLDDDLDTGTLTTNRWRRWP
jgi:predicted metal-dependent TIM-barrel fold hydrolase